MVRKKATSTPRPSIFAPPGKVMMIERNKLLGTPQQTPKSAKSLQRTPKSTPNKSANSTTTKPHTETRKRKVSQTIRAMREIRKFQATTKLLIPKAPFSRVVREIAQHIIGKPDIRFTALSLMALQEAAEMALINLLEIANLCCLHAKRVTLTPADIQLTRRAFGVTNALNG